MKLTETMLSTLVYEPFGSYEVSYHPDGPKDEEKEARVQTIDFTPPFKKLPILDVLAHKLNVTLPNAVDFGTKEANAVFDKLCKQHNVYCPRATNHLARLIDKLVGDLIEPELISPIFLTDHPKEMSPLAKWHRTIPGLTERFEMFCMSREVCNAYTELNDPMVQRERFEQQAEDKATGDDEGSRR